MFGAAAIVLLGGCGGGGSEFLVDPTVRPGMYEGRKVGCDLSFHLVHLKNHEEWSEAIGVTLLRYNIDGNWIGGIKIGYQPGPGVVERPQAAFLYDSNYSNEAEATRIAPGEDPRYLVVQFGPEQVSRRAFAFLEDRGIAKIGFRMADGKTQIWTLDLTHRADIQHALDKCLEGI